MAHQGEAIHLLWTGGWDSTFRLCQLLIDQRLPVQPIYITNRRKSRRAELQTMRALRTRLLALPGVADRLRPTLFVTWRDLPRTHRARNLAVLRRYRLAPQYDQLSRFRETYAADIEIGIEKPHRPRNRRHVQAGFVLADLSDEGGRLRADVPEPHRALTDVFGGFRFPLLHLTKRDMWDRAHQAGYAAILLRTWSCQTPARTPRRNQVPCGRCRPCRLRIARCGLVLVRHGGVRTARRSRRRHGATRLRIASAARRAAVPSETA